MLRVLPPMFKPVLQKNKTCCKLSVYTDFWLDKIKRQLRHTRELRHLFQNKFALGRWDAQMYSFTAKSRTIL